MKADTRKARLVIGAAALALIMPIAQAGDPMMKDEMGKKDGMTKSEMTGKDGTMKDGMAGKGGMTMDDKSGKGEMMKEGMAKDEDAMKPAKPGATEHSSPYK